MDQLAAVRRAIDLVQVPSRVRSARQDALPEGVATLLRIAAGEPGVIEAAAAATGRSPEFLHQAATFFIEQVLLAPDADSYRILGAARDAPAADLRHGMAMLLRWLHPDAAGQDSARAVFAARVTQAWEDLKSAERRAAYDLTRPDVTLLPGLAAKSAKAGHRSRRHRSAAPGSSTIKLTSLRQRMMRLFGRYS